MGGRIGRLSQVSAGSYQRARDHPQGSTAAALAAEVCHWRRTRRELVWTASAVGFDKADSAVEVLLGRSAVDTMVVGCCDCCGGC